MGSCRTPAVLLACLLTLLQPVRGWADPPPADLDRQAAVAWQRLEAVVDRYDAAQERLRTTRAQLAGVNAQLVPLTDQLNRLQDRVGTLAAGLYVTTGTAAGVQSNKQEGMFSVDLRDGYTSVRVDQAAAQNLTLDRACVVAIHVEVYQRPGTRQQMDDAYMLPGSVALRLKNLQFQCACGKLPE